MSSPWIARVGPKSNHKCPYKEHTEERHGGGRVKMEAETGETRPLGRPPAPSPQFPGAEEAGRILPSASKGRLALPASPFQTPGP